MGTGFSARLQASLGWTETFLGRPHLHGPHLSDGKTGSEHFPRDGAGQVLYLHALQSSPGPKEQALL